MVPLDSVPYASPTTNTVVLASDLPTNPDDPNSTGEFTSPKVDDEPMTAQGRLTQITTNKVPSTRTYEMTY